MTGNQTVPSEAEISKLARALRIPLVSDEIDRPSYIVCVQATGSEFFRTVMPTEAELRTIRQYLAYRKRIYFASFVAKMEREPYDIDSGVNTMTLYKWGDDHWGYRMYTWDRGPFTCPPALQVPHLSLAQVLDSRENLGTAWADWQRDHPVG